MGATRPRPVQRGTAVADYALGDLDSAVPASGCPTITRSLQGEGHDPAPHHDEVQGGGGDGHDVEHLVIREHPWP